MLISAIAAVSENYVIGKDNDLPWRLPRDLKWFKDVTSGHHIIMGRKNFQSMNEKPLPNRTNIIVTRQENYQAKDCIIVNSIKAGIEVAKKNRETEAFIVGGGEIYKQSLEFVDKMYITWVHDEFEGDTYFPKFDFNNWKLVSKKDFEPDEKNKYPFSICIYERKV